jgi:hypothetical protein
MCLVAAQPVAAAPRPTLDVKGKGALSSFLAEAVSRSS